MKTFASAGSVDDVAIHLPTEPHMQHNILNGGILLPRSLS